MSTPLTPEARDRLAEIGGVGKPFLYQCLNGHKQMTPALAVAVEQRTEGALRRWQLRTADWWLIWPEFVGTEGAPAIPATEAKA